MADLKATTFPAVMLNERGDPTWSVQVDLPPDIDAEIRRYVDEDQLVSWTVVIHEALYVYRTVFWTQEQLDAELQEGIEGESAAAKRMGTSRPPGTFGETSRQR